MGKRYRGNIRIIYAFIGVALWGGSLPMSQWSWFDKPRGFLFLFAAPDPFEQFMFSVRAFG